MPNILNKKQQLPANNKNINGYKNPYNNNKSQFQKNSSLAENKFNFKFHHREKKIYFGFSGHMSSAITKFPLN